MERGTRWRIVNQCEHQADNWGGGSRFPVGDDYGIDLEWMWRKAPAPRAWALRPSLTDEGKHNGLAYAGGVPADDPVLVDRPRAQPLARRSQWMIPAKRTHRPLGCGRFTA